MAATSSASGTPRARSLGVLCILLTLAGCQPKPAPEQLVQITPATHGDFPIETGTHALACESCHVAPESFAQFSCTSCHAHDQAPTDALHPALAGYQYDSASCLRCHPAGTAPPFSRVAFDPARNLTLDALLPAWSGTSITSLSAQTQSVSMTMAHGSTQVPAAALSPCTNCHVDAAAGVYYPGTLHSALANLQLAQPTACSDCHAVASPVGFIGPLATAPARTPASGEMRHDAVSWSGDLPTTTPVVTADCGLCHASPSQTLAATWATGTAGTTPARFHPALDSGGQPQPGSCLDCHANSRPPGVLTSANAQLPASLQFDHGTASALSDCGTCHLGTGSAASRWSAWAGGRFHLAGSSAPSTCLPCHGGERPVATTGWLSTSYAQSPFDYGTNALGITHGNGLDCATCHSGPGTGAWGGTQNWAGAHYTHEVATAAKPTCIACHMAQRPDLQPGATAAGMKALLGFDHAADGTGDCFGCHQATVSASSYTHYTNPATSALPGGDWKGGEAYPGSTLVGSPNQFITVTELSLVRSGALNLVTGTSATVAKLSNEMLHVSTALPAPLQGGPTGSPNYGVCWHCHTSSGGTVSSFADGQYHPSLDGFTANPGDPVTPLPQPTTQCLDCHGTMRPQAIVEKAASRLLPMDHDGKFKAAVVLGGRTVTGVAQMECATCHQRSGAAWDDGLFHSKIGSAAPQDCTVCHYPLMADAASSDVTSGVNFKMVHGSFQLTAQDCQGCHLGALAKGSTTPAVSTLWQGATYHPRVATQPTACVDCHAVSLPAANASTQSSVRYTLAQGGTATNAAQWMNHGSRFVAGKDCVSCHAADARSAGSAWNKGDLFHPAVSGVSSCKECHGLTNGQGTVPGTGNNLPTGLIDSTMTTSASAATGVPAGTHDQLDHSELNVASRDCNACHTQVGTSTAPGIAGQEWAQAKFHASFTAASPIVINGTTGRCSTCHLNVKPTASFTAQDHSAFTAVAGSQDCSACHAWPGTGTASAPNWLGATNMPAYINVGGFPIPQPPATTATTQVGINQLPHPAVGTGVACTTCHATASGGKGAFGYDHLSNLINSNCSSCHEAGSNLVGTAWNNVTAQASGAGDTRPFTLTAIRASYKSNTTNETRPNHFFPVDCAQCHVVPAGNGFVTTGSAYLLNSNGRSSGAWAFPHTQTKMTNPSTCVMCHTNGIPN